MKVQSTKHYYNKLIAQDMCTYKSDVNPDSLQTCLAVCAKTEMQLFLQNSDGVRSSGYKGCVFATTLHDVITTTGTCAMHLSDHVSIAARCSYCMDRHGSRV